MCMGEEGTGACCSGQPDAFQDVLLMSDRHGQGKWAIWGTSLLGMCYARYGATVSPEGN